MKNIKSAIVFILGIGTLAACKHDKSLFVNPNSPTTATPQTLLTSAEVSTINTYEGDLNRSAGILIQHSVGALAQAEGTQVYSLPQSLFDNQWSQIYQTLETAELLKLNFAAKDPYYAGIADIIMAMNWGLCSDLWGDIPFSHALSIDSVKFPTYDAQQLVLNGLIGLLDSGIAILSNDSLVNGYVPATDDIIFGGSRPNWVATAYTLRARYLNRFSNKSNYDPATILTDLSKGIQSASQNCMGIHGNSGTEDNQWYAYIQSRSYIVASLPFVDSLMLRPTDQRLYYYYAACDTCTLGGVNGSPVDNVTTQDISLWGNYLAAAASTPTPIVTYFEALFIKAEVEARTGDSTNAALDLNKAIMENCNEVTAGTYSGTDIATYTASTANLGRIMYEKWIAMFGQTEAYDDYRRTGLPALTPNPQGTLSVIPKRYPTPDQESNSNPNAPIPSLISPVWWAQ